MRHWFDVESSQIHPSIHPLASFFVPTKMHLILARFTNTHIPLRERERRVWIRMCAPFLHSCKNVPSISKKCRLSKRMWAAGADARVSHCFFSVTDPAAKRHNDHLPPPDAAPPPPPTRAAGGDDGGSGSGSGSSSSRRLNQQKSGGHSDSSVCNRNISSHHESTHRITIQRQESPPLRTTSISPAGRHLSILLNSPHRVASQKHIPIDSKAELSSTPAIDHHQPQHDDAAAAKVLPSSSSREHQSGMVLAQITQTPLPLMADREACLTVHRPGIERMISGLSNISNFTSTSSNVSIDDEKAASQVSCSTSFALLRPDHPNTQQKSPMSVSIRNALGPTETRQRPSAAANHRINPPSVSSTTGSYVQAELTTKGRKRKRLARACNACHKNKRRCDGFAPCSNW